MLGRVYEVLGEHAGEWFLRLPWEESPEVDVWAFTQGKRLDTLVPVPLEVEEDGKRVDFSFGSFGIPVVSKRLGALLESVAPQAVQLIPTTLRTEEGEWQILNVVDKRDCIDHLASIATYYPDDHRDKPGQLRGVHELAIKQEELNAAKLFRPSGWTTALLVSGQVRDVLKRETAGLRFVPIRVTTDSGFRKPDEV